MKEDRRATPLVIMTKKACLIKGGCPENADSSRIGQLATEKWGQLQRRLKQCTGKPGERMETLDEVARWGLNHDPPRQYGLGYPHFYSSSAVRPLSPVGCGVSISCSSSLRWT